MARRLVGAARAPLRALLLLCGIALASALYSSSGPVVEITEANQKAKLKGLVLLELYAPCVPAPTPLSIYPSLFTTRLRR